MTGGNKVMPDNIKITREQVIFLIFMSTLGNMVYSHIWIDDAADRAAWLVAFAGILLNIPLAAGMFYLGKYHPQKTLFDMLEDGLGKIPGILLGLLYITINIAVAVTMLNLFTQLLKTFFIMFTPSWIIMLFIVAIAVLFCSGAFKSFARTVEMLTVLGLLNYFVSFAHAFPTYIHTEYMFPIFDTPWPGLIKGALFIAGAASECLLLVMIMVAYIPDPGKHYMWAVYGLGAAAPVFSSAILFIMAMLSPELAKRIAFGGVNAAKIIQIGDFLQGLEVFIFGTYQFLAIGKTTVCLYCSWTAVKKICNNWQPRLLLLGSALMIFAPAVWLNSYNKAFQLATWLGGYVLLPFSVIMLLLAAVSTFIVKKKRERSL